MTDWLPLAQGGNPWYALLKSKFDELRAAGVSPENALMQAAEWGRGELSKHLEDLTHLPLA